MEQTTAPCRLTSIYVSRCHRTVPMFAMGVWRWLRRLGPACALAATLAALMVAPGWGSAAAGTVTQQDSGLDGPATPVQSAAPRDVQLLVTTAAKPAFTSPPVPSTSSPPASPDGASRTPTTSAPASPTSARPTPTPPAPFRPPANTPQNGPGMRYLVVGIGVAGALALALFGVSIARATPHPDQRSLARTEDSDNRSIETSEPAAQPPGQPRNLPPEPRDGSHDEPLG